jgi:hypothetical protein
LFHHLRKQGDKKIEKIAQFSKRSPQPKPAKISAEKITFLFHHVRKHSPEDWEKYPFF